MQFIDHQSDQKQSIGYATFSKTFFHQILPQISLYTCLQFQQQQWYVEISSEWTKILPELQAASCEELQLRLSQQHQDQHVPVLIMIAHVAFTDLISLSLSECKISNLEAISFYDMKNLQVLNLQHNQIISLKPMNKLSWPKIHTIYIYDNRLSQFSLDRIQTKSQFQSLYLDWPSMYKSSEYFINDSCVFGKMPNNKLSHLGCSLQKGFKRAIFKKRTIQALQQKWKQCIIE